MTATMYPPNEFEDPQSGLRHHQRRRALCYWAQLALIIAGIAALGAGLSDTIDALWCILTVALCIVLMERAVCRVSYHDFLIEHYRRELKYRTAMAEVHEENWAS